MHDIYRPKYKSPTTPAGFVSPRTTPPTPPSNVEGSEVVRFGEAGPDGRVREIVSSGPDWRGRRGRRPDPKLTADRLRTEIPRAVRKAQERLRAEGRHAEADHLDTRLRRWLRAQREHGW